MAQAPRKGDLRYFDGVKRDQELRALRRKVERLENGEEIQSLKKEKEKWRKRFEREQAARKRDTAKADRERRSVFEMWQKVNDDLWADMEAVQKENEKLKAENAALKKEKASLGEELKDAKAFSDALIHRLSKNHKNSSLPSSMDRPGSTPKKDGANDQAEGKDTDTAGKNRDNNSRRKSGKKPGAQPGHPHHPRKRLTPTTEPVMHTDLPSGLVDADDWVMTGEFVERDEVNVHIEVDVIPHFAAVWKNSKTGETRISPFPEGLHDETNYSKNTEAIVLMLTHFANVPARKAKQILSEMTDGVLNVSHGWIANLPGKFSKRCGAEIAQIIADLFASDVMHVDSTVTKNNGTREAVSVACSRQAKAVLLTHTKHKGGEAADSLPCAKGSGYKGTVVSDEEEAFKGLGTDHQFCIAHMLRKLQSIIEMEPDSEWAREMQTLLREMVHAAKKWQQDDAETCGPTLGQVRDWEERCDEILRKGRQHYIENPPTKHYLEGHNTRCKLAEDKDKWFLFIHKPNVPPTNNEAERALRTHKRALHQAVTFRSGKSIDDRCTIESVIQTARMRQGTILSTLREVLERSLPGPEEELQVEE